MEQQALLIGTWQGETYHNEPRSINGALLSRNNGQASERSERAGDKERASVASERSELTSVASVAKMQHFSPYYIMYIIMKI